MNAPRHRAALSLLAAALAALAAAAGCRPASPQEREARLLGRIDGSLLKAGKYLLAAQSPDGAWRSEHYGCFRDGPELTPYVMSCLFFLPQLGEEGQRSYRRGVDYLVKMVAPDGSIRAGERGLNFPVYTAASASRVVKLQERSERNMRAHRAWLAYVRARQLTAGLGWKQADPQFGGWGFALGVPRKPEPGGFRGRFVESNLSATIFGIAALRSAKVPADDPGFRDALTFAKRCQNWSDDPAGRDPRFDDGGFFFIPDDPLQNKAGVAGKDRFGRTRFHSYGSMTVDGVRALIRCGLPRDHPRVTAARRWLERNFDAANNPGAFAKDREVLRNATYYYWVWGVAHAFMGLRVREIRTPRGKVRWAEVLAEELIRRQEKDGSWVNRRFTDAKEDDPLVAAPWAVAALAICRGVLSGHGPGHGRAHPTLQHPAGKPAQTIGGTVLEAVKHHIERTDIERTGGPLMAGYELDRAGSQAHSALSALRAEDVPAVVATAAQTTDAQERKAAGLVLVRCKLPEARKAVVRFLEGEGTTEFRIYLLSILRRRHNIYAVPSVLKLFSSDDAKVRLAAVRSTWELQDPRAVPALGRLVLDEPDEALANAAAGGLSRTMFRSHQRGAKIIGRGGPPRWWRRWWEKYGKRYEDWKSPDRLALMRRLLSDPDPDVRSYAIRGCYEWAAPALAEAVFSEGPEYIRWAALHEIVGFQDRKYIPLFVRALQAKESYKGFSVLGAWGLDWTFFWSGVPDDDRAGFWRKWWARHGKRYDKVHTMSYIDTIRLLQSDPSPAVRARAAAGVRCDPAGEKGAADLFAKTARSDNEEPAVRLGAIRGLARLRWAGLFKLYELVRTEKDETRRRVAAESLEEALKSCAQIDDSYRPTFSAEEERHLKDIKKWWAEHKRQYLPAEKVEQLY